jgi:hypothetical protein
MPEKIYISEDATKHGKTALWIIWVCGIICIIIIWMFFKWSGSNTTGSVSPFFVRQGKKQVKSIDALLLSSEEVKQDGQKYFVNVALRLQWNSRVPDINEGVSRKKMYNAILKKKLQHIQKNDPTDFYIKPVPR